MLGIKFAIAMYALEIASSLLNSDCNSTLSFSNLLIVLCFSISNRVFVRDIAPSLELLRLAICVAYSGYSLINFKIVSADTFSPSFISL
jgi:hypothetical protein